MNNSSFEIIPAIDILGGRCVRLLYGDYSQVTTYGDDPVAMAQHWESQGAQRLHVVDLDGAKTGTPANHVIIKKIAKTLSIPVQTGGGIRSVESAQQLLDAGVQRVIIGSAALESPNTLHALLSTLHKDAIILGLDLKNGQPALHGWLETVNTDVFALLENFVQQGIGRLILTDISKDGALAGPNFELFQNVTQRVTIPVIASGGVTTLSDIKALSRINGVEGCIVGKALYEGKLTLGHRA